MHAYFPTFNCRQILTSKQIKQMKSEGPRHISPPRPPGNRRLCIYNTKFILKCLKIHNSLFYFLEFQVVTYQIKHQMMIFLLFFYFISIFILLSCRKATEALIHRVSNYPDLLPEMPRYCCPLVI